MTEVGFVFVDAQAQAGDADAQRMLTPTRGTPGAAGLDLVAANVDVIALDPGKRALVPTGIALVLPPGFEGQIRPRSGLALKQGVTCLNTPGTVDSDYRGELKVLLINHGDAPFVIERGMRIAQLVIARVEPVAAGFGSTGV